MALPTLENVSEITTTTNSSIGIIDNLFGKRKANSFYEEFYSAFLTTANSLPINSLWIVFINNIPTSISQTVQNYENMFIEEELKKAQTEAQRKRGILIAQGVKVIGEANNITRDGIKNTGFIQGLVSNGREGFPLLTIGFLENNISFTDYFLRPWQIAVSHRSLKKYDLKTDITVWFLSKAGAKKDLKLRKAVTYRNCCPVNIDEQEYNYSGSDVYKVRQVQFAFSTYEMGNVDKTLLELININDTTNSLLDSLKAELQRQFGAATPAQYLNNLIDRAKDFGSQLIRGTATNIVTNVAGTIQDKVESAITSVESGIRGQATRLNNNINNIVNGALGNAGGNRNNSASLPTGGVDRSVAAQVETTRTIGANGAPFGGYVQKNINIDDTPHHVVPIHQELRGKPAEVNINVPINKNDAPMHEQSTKREFMTEDPNADTVTLITPLRYYVRKSDPPMNDVRHGEINHQDVEQKIPQNDYVSSLQVNNAGKSISSADTPDRRSIKYVDKNINEDDVPTGGSIKYIAKTINQDDAPEHKSK